MPFVSAAQEKWAFSNKKPWAQRWADETPKGAKLPEHVTPKRMVDRIKKKLIKKKFNKNNKK